MLNVHNCSEKLLVNSKCKLNYALNGKRKSKLLKVFSFLGNTSNTFVVIVLNGFHCLICDLIELLFELCQLIEIIFIFISVTIFAEQLIIQAKENFIDLVVFIFGHKSGYLPVLIRLEKCFFSNEFEN